MFDTARNLLLALLLMLSQAGLALHQIDFDQHHDGGACVLCLAAHGFDHVVPAAFAAQLVQTTAEPPLATLTTSQVCPEPPFRFARAPPISPP